MRQLALFCLLLCGSVSVACAASLPSLTSLRDIHALTNEMVGGDPPVEFQATITYSVAYQQLLFVQDGDASIFVNATPNPSLLPGDRVLVKGTAHPSFHPMINASEVRFLHHGAVPEPLPVTYDQMLLPESDCRLVKLQAVVRSADVVSHTDHHRSTLHLLSGAGEVDAVLNSDDDQALSKLLDSKVEVTAVIAGKFDRKMERIGVQLYISTLADIKVLKHPDTSPWSLPATPIDQVFKGYRVFDDRQRVRVQGSVTLYDPGAAVVLQDGSKSIWIYTESRAPLKIGDLADATGFPESRTGHLTLTTAEIRDRQIQSPIKPLQTTAKQLASRVNIFDLVELEGKVVTEARTDSRDEYVLEADGVVFSAIVRRPTAASRAPLPAMKQVPVGAIVRVTGVCIPEDSGRFDRDRGFSLLLRNDSDLVMVAEPSWVNTRTLIVVVLLLLLVIVVGTAFLIRAKMVQRETHAAALRNEKEASLERMRGRILEDISGDCPLSEVLDQITSLVSYKLDGATCWIQVPEEHWVAQPVERYASRILSKEIPSRSGPSLGSLYIALDWRTAHSPDEAEALSAGAGLASLAIETRKLYQDLIHRSEFDLLTNLHNRYSLDRQLEARIGGSRQNGAIFGLIYIDLDRFKEINDLYGHRVGDLFLCEVAHRLSAQLRPVDMLARLGGDEFAALTPEVHSRADVEEIAQRLETCFEPPFFIEGHSLCGSASIGVSLYPEDGADRVALFRAADEAMYKVKHERQQASEEEALAE